MELKATIVRLAGAKAGGARLLSVHNLKASNLVHAQEVGGLIAPSIAIVNPEFTQMSKTATVVRLAAPPSVGGDSEIEEQTMSVTPPSRFPSFLPGTVGPAAPYDAKEEEALKKRRRQKGPSPTKVKLEDFEVTPGEGLENIRKVLAKATPEEVDYWGRWYLHSHEDVKKLSSATGVPFETVAAMVAVLSPSMKWELNLEAAQAIILGTDKPFSGKIPGSPARGGFGANQRKAKEILKSGDTSLVTGPKVQVFFQSIVNPQGTQRAIVLDGHAANIWWGEKKPLKGLSISPQERAQMVADYRQVGEESGLGGQAVQAITWSIWRAAEGGKKKKQATITIVAHDSEPKETLDWQGLTLAIEYLPGEFRYQGTPMQAEVPKDFKGYGYVVNRQASDGDSLDVLLGPDFSPDWDADVFLVVQKQKETGEFLQFKVFLGFPNRESAEAGFLSMWPKDMYGGISSVSTEDLLQKFLDKISVPSLSPKTAKLSPAQFVEGLNNLAIGTRIQLTIPGSPRVFVKQPDSRWKADPDPGYGGTLSVHSLAGFGYEFVVIPEGQVPVAYQAPSKAPSKTVVNPDTDDDWAVPDYDKEFEEEGQDLSSSARRLLPQAKAIVAETTRNLRRIYELEYKVAMLSPERKKGPLADRAERELILMQQELDRRVNEELSHMAVSYQDWLKEAKEIYGEGTTEGGDAAFDRVLRITGQLLKPPAPLPARIVLLHEALTTAHNSASMATFVYGKGRDTGYSLAEAIQHELDRLSEKPDEAWDKEIKHLVGLPRGGARVTVVTA